MKKLKKGFTLLELVIVIAVFAILAAILIPTFASMLRRARISNDIILVKNLNTIAFANEQENGKSKTASDALVALAENGYIVDRLTPTADNAYILWDSVNDRFVLWDKGKITFHDENTKILKNSVDYWLFTDDYSETITKNLYYSVYLKEGYAGETLDICTGLDVGENTGIKQINYTNINEAAQDVVIRTNSFETKLTVNAPLDTLAHYGYVSSVDVQAIEGLSYDEYGKAGRIEVKQGHVEAMDGCEIFCLMEAPSTAGAVKDTTVNTGAMVHTNMENINAAEGIVKDENTGVGNGHIEDCGAGRHSFSKLVVDSQHVYDVCTCCGYTLINVLDNAGTIVKQSKNILDENGKVTEEVTTPLVVYETESTINVEELQNNVKNYEVTEAITDPVKPEQFAAVTEGEEPCTHNFVEKVSLAPTCISEGAKTYECSNCHANYNIRLPLAAHKYYDNVGHKHTADEKCIVCGHIRGDKEIARAIVSGVETKFASLTAAIEAAPTDGTEFKITMLADDAATLRNDGGYGSWFIKASQNVVIDLAGYTLKGLIGFDTETPDTTTYNNGTFRIANGAALTIMDSSCKVTSYDGTGKVYSEIAAGVTQSLWPAVNRCDNTILNNGTFTLLSGTLENRAEGQILFVIDNLGSGAKVPMNCNIKGGKLSSNTVCSLIRMWGSGSKGLTVNVEEGYFYSENTNAIWSHFGDISNSSLIVTGGLFDTKGFFNTASINNTITGGTYNSIKAENYITSEGKHLIYNLSTGMFTVGDPNYSVSIIKNELANVTKEEAENNLESTYVDVWDFWGAKGYLDSNKNECPQYIRLSDTTVYTKDGDGTTDAVSGKTCWDQYFSQGKYVSYILQYKDVTYNYYFDNEVDANTFAAQNNVTVTPLN